MCLEEMNDNYSSQGALIYYPFMFDALGNVRIPSFLIWC